MNDHLERPLGTITWNDHLERPLGTTTWNDHLERPLGTIIWNDHKEMSFSNEEDDEHFMKSLKWFAI